jgi:hypothetical protein
MRLKNETDPEMLRRAALLLEKENKRLVQKIIDLTNELVTVKGGGAEPCVSVALMAKLSSTVCTTISAIGLSSPPQLGWP